MGDALILGWFGKSQIRIPQIQLSGVVRLRGGEELEEKVR
jgi:hypothetical protein